MEYEIHTRTRPHSNPIYGCSMRPERHDDSGERARFTTLHTLAREENGCDRPQLRRRRAPIRARAQGSRCAEEKFVSSSRRFVVLSRSSRSSRRAGTERISRRARPRRGTRGTSPFLTSHNSSNPRVPETVPRGRVSRSVRCVRCVRRRRPRPRTRAIDATAGVCSRSRGGFRSIRSRRSSWTRSTTAASARSMDGRIDRGRPGARYARSIWFLPSVLPPSLVVRRRVQCVRV